MLKLDFKPMLSAIKRKRESLDFTQEYMAAKLSTSQNTYSKMELGNTQVTVERFLKICKILDLDYAYLLGMVKATVSKEELRQFQSGKWQREM